MNAKITSVTLCANGMEKSFEISHAERILNLKNNGGWILSDENFIFENGKLERISNKQQKTKRDCNSDNAGTEDSIPCDGANNSDAECANE